MRSVEISARKREDAINKALQELGIERHEAHVEILDEGSPGFLGIGVRDVTVRVSTDVPGEGGFPVEADGNRVDAEHRGNRRDRKPGPRDGAGKRPPKRERTNGDRGPRAQQRGRANDRSNRNRRDNRDNKGGRRDRPDRPGRQDRPGQQKGRPGKPHRPEASRAPDRPRPPRPERPREERPRPEPKERPPAKVLTDARSNEAASLLHEIISSMGMESTVQPVESEQGGLKLAVESPDSALLIGRKGRNLTSMQYLINRIFNRQDEWQQTERIIVDVEGYLDRRRDTLEEMAVRLAERAKATGRRVRVKPLSPQERRIIHLALHEDPEVRTFSVGESNFRSVIIAPVTEGETGEEEDADEKDYRDEYGDSALDNPAANGADDDLLDDYDDDADAAGEQPDRGHSPAAKRETLDRAEDAAKTAQTPGDSASADDSGEDAAEDEDGGAGSKRFRSRRGIGRRGAVRKRRPQKPLASVSANEEKTGAAEPKEDASGDSDNS